MKDRIFIFLATFSVILLTISACRTNPEIEETDEDTANSTGDIEDVSSGNSEDHEAPEDYLWDAGALISISFSDSKIDVPVNSALSVAGKSITILKGGTYELAGTLPGGQVVVNSSDDGTVQLIFNGINISNETTSPVFIKQAEKTVIILAAGSENFLKDGTKYVFATNEDEPDATIFSKDDLSFFGEGTLTVESNYNDAIVSKDGLIIKSGNLDILSIDDGIRGKDYLIIRGGNISIKSSGDGLKSDNDEDEGKGFIEVDEGTVNITSGGDAMQASTDIVINNGVIGILAGGGSSNYISENVSAKGIKASAGIIIDNGTFSVNAADDAVHSNGTIIINGGTFSVASGDDAFHSDADLQINGGTITIWECYEGIESAAGNIYINNGEIHVNAGDDGINVAGGGDGSGMWGPGQQPGNFTASGKYWLYINDGYIVIEADGDGIDANGSVQMTGGKVIVNGPTADFNGAIDYDGTFKITGGFLIAAGSAGMAQSPDASSSQYSLLINFNSALAAGTLVHLQGRDGTGLFTFRPSKRYQSVAFSSSGLKKDQSYEIYYGGSTTGILTDGLLETGNYSPGTKYQEFTVLSMVTRLGR